MLELKKQCLAKIEEAYTIAEKHFDTKIPRIPVEFSTKLTKTAGKVHYMRNGMGSIKMTLSVPILRDNPAEFVARTPGHEAAHHIVHCVYGTETQAHGREWKFVMNLIGQSAERTHRMKTTTANGVAASCGCKTHMITKQRATKMRRGASYYCRKCKQNLVLGTQVKAPVLKPAAAPVFTPKQKVVKTMSNAARARELIMRNPRASEVELIELLRNSDIPVKPNMLKVVIQVNVKKVRG